MTIEQLKQVFHERGIRHVKLGVFDLDGVLRGKYVSPEKFFSAAEGGLGFCDVIFGWDITDVLYDNAKYTGWHTGYPDAQARVDVGTYRQVPWDGDVPFFLADFEDGSGKPLPLCPRQVLKQVLARAESAGFRPSCGLEFEWFNFKETPQTWADKKGMPPTPIT